MSNFTFISIYDKKVFYSLCLRIKSIVKSFKELSQLLIRIEALRDLQFRPNEDKLVLGDCETNSWELLIEILRFVILLALILANIGLKDS